MWLVWEVLVRNLEGKRQFGGPSRKWEGSNRIDIKAVERDMWKEFMWARIRPAIQACDDGTENLGSIKYGEFCD